MIPDTWFHTVERRTALELAAGRWLGTPWVWGSATCHVGADCVRLCAALYAETGALADFTLPPGRSHSSRRLPEVVAWLEARPEFARVIGRNLAAGDLLLFADTHLHFGVALNYGRFIQSLNPTGVELARTDDVTLMSRLAGAWCVTDH